ncbi:ras association domain-containing protein 5 isoform X2 [Girardinichthys multiradiatus]|uniref:ras association domain-containing protein 5 isoform X2 n=1 Tax=Girardinichthys multiradiatus TaxID=208333 RepID=UPI001FAE0035|nr:ras association domain-containing protein 5 isoform X2 [Girardinichthys multiradiatus]
MLLIRRVTTTDVSLAGDEFTVSAHLLNIYTTKHSHCEERSVMASVSVVGQQPGPHRLDSEPQILLFKLSGTKKKISLPRRSSWEKMMLARSGMDAAEEELRTRPLRRPGPGGGRMPAGGCGATAGLEAPRSPTQDGAAGGCGGVAPGMTGHITNGFINCDSNQNKGCRRGGSLKEPGVYAMPSGTGNRPKRAHRHRDASQGRRGSRNGDSHSGHQSVSSAVLPPGERRCLPLERLTQGRTGLVKLARTEPHRREAWSIFPREMDPRVRAERGEGHRFETKPVKQDWCDACSRQITAQGLQCQNCSYTCHLECEGEVQLDCNQRDRETEESSDLKCCSSSSSSSAAPRFKSETKEEEEGGAKELSEEEVRTKIESYNAQVSENGMNLAEDGSFTGFIKVHLRLSRPVTVEGNQGRAPLDDQDGKMAEHTEKRTSFYLPCDCVKQIHIGSLTTTSEVIQGLLKKFLVLDDPRKFALYRQTHRDGQDLFQKLPLSEHPLVLRLIAGPDAELLTFVLKENETGEVEWHAFSVPELQNFLVILEKEEAERVRAVQQKYTIYRQKLQQALQQHGP